MGLSKEQIDNLETRLILQKAQIEAELESMRKRLDFGSDIDHFEEETDEAEEVATYLGIEATLKKRLMKIEEALDRIQGGNYGTCKKCKGEISLEVLEQQPESSMCTKCKRGG